MTVGPWLTLLGAALVTAGATALDWLRLPDVATGVPAWALAPSGQVVVGLAVVGFLASVIGIFAPRRRRETATASLFVAVAIGAWMAAGALTGAGVAEADPTPGAGFAIAGWGAWLMAMSAAGSLVVARAARGPRVVDVTVRVDDELRESHRLDQRKAWLTLPKRSHEGVESPVAFHLDRHGEAVVGLPRSEGQRLTIRGRGAKRGAAGVLLERLRDGDWGVVDLGGAAVHFEVRPAPARDARPRPLLAALTGAAILVQVGLVGAGATEWLAPGERTAELQLTEPVAPHARFPAWPDVAPVIGPFAPSDDLSRLGRWLVERLEARLHPDGAAKRPPRSAHARRPREEEHATGLERLGRGLNALLADGRRAGGAIAAVLEGDSGIDRKVAEAMEGGGLAADGARAEVRFHGRREAAEMVAPAGRLEPSAAARSAIGLGAGKQRREVKAAPVLGRPRTVGSCDDGGVSRAVRRKAAAILSCYERRLQLSPRLQGRVELRWTVGADGRARGMSATDDTVGDPAVRRCLERTMRRVRFPAPASGVCVVQWPFIFTTLR